MPQGKGFTSNLGPEYVTPVWGHSSYPLQHNNEVKFGLCVSNNPVSMKVEKEEGEIMVLVGKPVRWPSDGNLFSLLV